MKCPECGKTLAVVAADGDGRGNTVTEYKCDCGLNIEQESRIYPAKTRPRPPVLVSHVTAMLSAQESLDLTDFEEAFGPDAGPRFWMKFQTDFHANFLRFWGYLDTANQLSLLGIINKHSTTAKLIDKN